MNNAPLLLCLIAASVITHLAIAAPLSSSSGNQKKLTETIRLHAMNAEQLYIFIKTHADLITELVHQSAPDNRTLSSRTIDDKQFAMPATLLKDYLGAPENLEILALIDARFEQLSENSPEKLKEMFESLIRATRILHELPGGATQQQIIRHYGLIIDAARMALRRTAYRNVADA